MKTIETNQTRIEAPQSYESPAVEIFEIEVEKGFAVSGDPSPATDPAPNSGGTGKNTWGNNGPWG